MQVAAVFLLHRSFAVQGEEPPSSGNKSSVLVMVDSSSSKFVLSKPSGYYMRVCVRMMVQISKACQQQRQEQHSTGITTA